MLYREEYVSRTSFCKELRMGEGAVKTLILHLKQEGLAGSVRSGTYLTKKGQKFIAELYDVVPKECNVKKCSIAQGKNNHAVLLRNFSGEIKSGIEQRDAAILYGATGAITMIFQKDKFVFPGEDVDCLQKDRAIRSSLLEALNPHDGDVIIIAAASDRFVAEISAKNSALFTLAKH